MPYVTQQCRTTDPRIVRVAGCHTRLRADLGIHQKCGQQGLYCQYDSSRRLHLMRWKVFQLRRGCGAEEGGLGEQGHESYRCFEHLPKTV